MLILAHRGASAYAAENTMDAFREAIRLGAHGIELDVQLSNDGELVVFHDLTTDRLCGYSNRIAEMSSSEIKALTIAGAETIPTLTEVLEWCPRGCIINIELKAFDTADPVISLLNDLVGTSSHEYRQFIVSSFDWLALQHIRKQEPRIRLGVLTDTDPELAYSFARFINAESIHCYYHLLTPQNSERMQNNGLDVYAWTVNEPTDISNIRSFNITGIITDYPDRI